VTGAPPELLRARQWAAELVAALDEITDEVGTAARRLVEGWPDAAGRDWAQRLHLLHHGLRGDADAAADFGRAVDRVALETDADRAGPLLGGTGGRRAGDRRGVTIPQLNDPDDLSG
jgi:hypothetical protein